MKAECTWGDGPDVLVILDGTEMVLHENPYDLDKWAHGKVKSGSIDLTADRALELAKNLMSAVRQAKNSMLK